MGESRTAKVIREAKDLKDKVDELFHRAAEGCEFRVLVKETVRDYVDWYKCTCPEGLGRWNNELPCSLSSCPLGRRED